MIPLLQSIDTVQVPVVIDPINLGGSGGEFGLLMFAVILAVIVCAAIAFMAHSKASALAMYRERDQERRQDDRLAQLTEKVADREHWLQHQIEGGRGVVPKVSP
jgi:uncharacterized membrane protein